MSEAAKTLAHFAAYVPLADEDIHGDAWHSARTWAAWIIASGIDPVKFNCD